LGKSARNAAWDVALLEYLNLLIQQLKASVPLGDHELQAIDRTALVTEDGGLKRLGDLLFDSSISNCIEPLPSAYPRDSLAFFERRSELQLHFCNPSSSCAVIARQLAGPRDPVHAHEHVTALMREWFSEAITDLERELGVEVSTLSVWPPTEVYILPSDWTWVGQILEVLFGDWSEIISLIEESTEQRDVLSPLIPALHLLLLDNARARSLIRDDPERRSRDPA